MNIIGNSITHIQQNIMRPIPRMLESGANIIAVHLKDAMERLLTHTPLHASTATGALMESTAEARLTFKHNLDNIPQKMFQGLLCSW